MTTNNLPFYARFCMILVSIYVLGMLIYAGSDIIIPICFAILLAMLLLPVVNWLMRKGIPGIPSIIMAILVAALFVGGIIYFLSFQVANFMSDLPAIKEKITQHITTLQNWINDQLNITKKQQTAAVESAKQNTQGQGAMGSALLGAANVLVMMILLPIYTFLILFYRKLIHKFLMDVFPSRHKPQVEEVIRESQTIVQGYMVGLLLEMFIVTVLNTTGFLILGVQYAVFLGLLAAVLNLIPYIGGEFPYIGRYKDMPAEDGKKTDSKDAEKIMHVSLPISKETMLMGSDTGGEWAPNFTIGNNFSISINTDSKAEADRLFNRLSSGGAVSMPMNKTFWGDYFGMFTDKFGINWMVSFNEAQQKK